MNGKGVHCQPLPILQSCLGIDFFLSFLLQKQPPGFNLVGVEYCKFLESVKLRTQSVRSCARKNRGDLASCYAKVCSTTNSQYIPPRMVDLKPLQQSRRSIDGPIGKSRAAQGPPGCKVRSLISATVFYKHPGTAIPNYRQAEPLQKLRHRSAPIESAKQFSSPWRLDHLWAVAFLRI